MDRFEQNTKAFLQYYYEGIIIESSGNTALFFVCERRRPNI